MGKLLTHPITGAITPRNIAAYLREPVQCLEFVNTGTDASARENWKIATFAYTVVAGDVLRYDVWSDPFNPVATAGGIDLIFTTAPNAASSAGVNDQLGSNISIFSKTDGAWFARTCDLTPIVGKALTQANLTNYPFAAGAFKARYRNIRITDATGNTVRVNIWLTGDPAFNESTGSSASMINQNATWFSAGGWLGDPAFVSIAMATDAAVRDGMQHEQGLAVFPETTDAASDTGIQAGGSFKGEIAVVPRALAPALEFRLRRTQSANGFTYWKIAAPAYVVIAGDVVRYDVWVDPRNATNTNGIGAMELDFSDATTGRSLSLSDQNATALNIQPVGSIGQWMSRTISLTPAAGKTISFFDLVGEADVGGCYRALYRNIRITDAAGTTLRVTIWSSGAPSLNADNYSQNTIDQLVSVIDAPLTTDLTFTRGDQLLASPRYVIGKTFELALVSQVSENGIVVREIQEVRRAKASKATLSRNILSVDFADLTDLALDALYPPETYTVADFAGLFEGHVGHTIADGVGLLRRVPMKWIKKAGGDFRHAICKKRTGYTYAVQAIYRGDNANDIGSVVPSGEYTQGVSTGAVSALDVVDVGFTNEQLGFSNQPYSLSADILVTKGTGVTDASLASEEIKYLLTLKGLTADAASFAAAATYGDTNKMRVAAGYTKPLKLRAILTDLAFVARAMLSRTASGRFAILQDKAGTSVGTWLEESDAVAIGDVEYTDKPAKVLLSYRPARAGTEEYLASPRERLPGGSRPDIEYHCPYIDDHEIADRTIDYYAKRESVGETVRATIHGVQLDARELVTLTGSGAWIGDKTWRITEVRRPADKNDLQLALYDAAIHTYTAAALPSGATNVYTPDYSETPPVAPTSLAVISSGIRIDTPGVGLAYALVRAVPPTFNWAKLTAQIRNNTTNEIYQAQLALASGNYEAVIPGLRPGDAHTIIAWATNANNVDGAVTAGLAHTAATWSGTPAAPTSVIATQTGADQIEVKWTPSGGGALIAYYVPYISVAGGAYSALPAVSAAQTKYPGAPFGNTVQFKVKAYDTFNNASADSSPSTSFTPAPYIYDGHITPLGIGTGSLAALGVTGGKIGTGEVYQNKLKSTNTSTTYTVAAGGNTNFYWGTFACGQWIASANQFDFSIHPGVTGAPFSAAFCAKNNAGVSRDVTFGFYQIEL